MIPGSVKVTQEVCIKKDKNLIQLTGRVFARNRITDVVFKESLGGLNDGIVLQMKTDGGVVKWRTGRYMIEATRSVSVF